MVRSRRQCATASMEWVGSAVGGVVLLVACAADLPSPAADQAPAPDHSMDASAAAPIEDVAPPAPLPDVGRGDLSVPDLMSWPTGFSPQPTSVPTGPLCAIAPDYVESGGDPVNPPCAVEADSFSSVDHNLMPSALKVVTWNVEFGKRSAEVLRALATDTTLLDADVLLFQEVPRLDWSSDPPRINLAREMARKLKKNYVFAVEWDRRRVKAGGGEHGFAVLSRFPFGNVELIRHSPAHNHYAEKKLFGGRATLAVEIAIGGQRVRFYNAHLATRDVTGHARATQGAEILANARQATRPLVQVLGGDLNTFLCNPALLACNKPPAAEQVVEQILADGWIDLLPGFNSWTQLGAGFFRQRLDWLFAKQVTPIWGKVLQHVRPADHVPVLAVFSIP